MEISEIITNNHSCLCSNSRNIHTLKRYDYDIKNNHKTNATPNYLTEVTESLNATSKYIKNEYGKTEHHINQYILKEEIGRGSFGAVHLAVDQFNIKYAIKELSKSRLRRKAQSSTFKKPHSDRTWPTTLTARSGLNLPRTAHNIHKAQMLQNPLYLIKGEIEVMKRFNHPNLVQLIEVLDDPEEDSLYMVLELCAKGVVTKVKFGERANPHSIENCRKWFQQMISGIEHLHEQGIVHGDIKPDNLLLTEDNVLKIADFGVSEVFEKGSNKTIFKFVGSPAFTPPELCVTKHGYVSGTAADIWSLGISLYCLRFGHLPFEHSRILELFEAIKNEDLKLDINPIEESDFHDLLMRLLDKNPKKRAKIDELKVHPWVTKNKFEPLPKLVFIVSEDSINIEGTETMEEKRLSKPAIVDQELDPEREVQDSSIVFEPITFGIKLNLSNQTNKNNDSERQLYPQMTVFQENIEQSTRKHSRQRIDSGIELNDNDQLLLSNSLFIEPV